MSRFTRPTPRGWRSRSATWSRSRRRTAGGKAWRWSPIRSGPAKSSCRFITATARNRPISTPGTRAIRSAISRSSNHRRWPSGGSASGSPNLGCWRGLPSWTELQRRRSPRDSSAAPSVAQRRDSREDGIAMAKTFKVGDHVSWNSEAGRVSGHIVRVHTSDVNYKGYIHHASEDEPQYEIQSDKTDHVALHKGGALRRLSR